LDEKRRQQQMSLSLHHEGDLPTLLSPSRRRPAHKHKRQLSQGTQLVLDRLDHHEQRLEEIVQQPSGQQVMQRLSTRKLLEKLDEHALEVERLLQAGADMLATGGSQINRFQLEFDHDEFSEASGSTASSCGDSCSGSSSPCSFRLISDDEDAEDKAVLARFDLSVSAHELKCLHRELYAVRKELSGAQVERLDNVVQVLTSAVINLKK
jgi:hypothetical protein